MGLVLQQFLTSPDKPWWGYGLMQATGLPSGTLYPILARLVSESWLTRRRDDSSRRYFYQLTPAGKREAHALLVSLAAQFSGAVKPPQAS
jgi:PadR family transcriptional regulator, regulatory protein PadR